VAATNSARQIADGLLAATDRHLAGREPSDDRTVVVLKVSG
jgi:serine phosphatase RsbU (regulator of sigma subunit)